MLVNTDLSAYSPAHPPPHLAEPLRADVRARYIARVLSAQGPRHPQSSASCTERERERDVLAEARTQGKLAFVGFSTGARIHFGTLEAPCYVISQSDEYIECEIRDPIMSPREYSPAGGPSAL